MTVFFAVGFFVPKNNFNTENMAAATETVETENMPAGSKVFLGGGERYAAHRGYSNYAPENSIAAFELAGKMGFWGIETDFYQTADGQFICLHDETLDRTTDGTGKPGDYTLEQLMQFNIDSGNYIETTENLKIPTMTEYLEICKKYSCVAVAEIKGVSDYDSFLNTIVSSGMEEMTIITGTLDDIKEIRARNSVIPVMTIGYTPAPYTDNLNKITEILENRGILYNYPQVDKAAVDILHSQGIYCGVWSVDDEETAEKYTEYGVDFIVTNEIPARLNHMINENE